MFPAQLWGAGGYSNCTEELELFRVLLNEYKSGYGCCGNGVWNSHLVNVASETVHSSPPTHSTLYSQIVNVSWTPDRPPLANTKEWRHTSSPATPRFPTVEKSEKLWRADFRHNWNRAAPKLQVETLESCWDSDDKKKPTDSPFPTWLIIWKEIRYGNVGWALNPSRFRETLGRKEFQTSLSK